MLRKWSLVCFMLLVVVGFAAAQEMSTPTVEFEGRYWFTELSGNARISEGSIPGTEIDLKSDLGIDDKNVLEGRLTWYPGPNSKIRAAYTQFDFDGDKDVNRTIVFNGKTYDVGTRVITDVNVKYLRVGWAWEFISFADGKVKLGTLLEGKGFWIDASLAAPNSVPPIDERKKLSLGLPTIGATLDINPSSMINIFAEASGIPAGNLGYFIDAEGGIKFIPVKYVSIVGGYRILNVKAEDDSDFIKVKAQGPFAAATIRF